MEGHGDGSFSLVGSLRDEPQRFSGRTARRLGRGTGRRGASCGWCRDRGRGARAGAGSRPGRSRARPPRGSRPRRAASWCGSTARAGRPRGSAGRAPTRDPPADRSARSQASGRRRAAAPEPAPAYAESEPTPTAAPASPPVRALAERLSAEGREALARIEAQLAALDRLELAKRSLEWHEAQSAGGESEAPGPTPKG